MSRPRIMPVALAVTLLATLVVSGCGTYHYMRDISPELQRARQEYVVNNPGNKYNDDIEAGRVREGMSRLQVRVTWGDPDQVTPRGAGGEVWSYQEEEPPRGTSIYSLHFQGELLTAVDVSHGGADLPPEANKPVQSDRSDLPRTDTSGKPGGFLN